MGKGKGQSLSNSGSRSDLDVLSRAEQLAAFEPAHSPSTPTPVSTPPSTSHSTATIHVAPASEQPAATTHGSVAGSFYSGSDVPLNRTGSSFLGDAREMLRKEARASLYFFAKTILGHKDFVPHVHGPGCILLEKWHEKNVAIMLPRSHFKSTMGSESYPIWESIQVPDPKIGRPGNNVRILIAQNTGDNALKKMAAIKSHWDRNKLLRALFPELLPTTKSRWTSECLQLNRESNDPEATYEGMGIAGQVTSRHYDVIIEDDTVAPDLDELGEDNMAPTKDDIDQAIGWHRLNGSSGGPLFNHPLYSRSIIIGTRWFEKDLLSWIKENQKKYKWYERAAIEEGQPIWAERFPGYKLDELRASLGPYMFNCLYLNQPMRSDDMVFRPDWWKFYDTEPRDLVIYTTLDPAGDPKLTKKRKNDYSVVMTCGKDVYTGRIYILHYDRLRGNPGEVIDTLFRHVRVHKPVKVAVEANAYQHTMIYWINERKKKEDLRFFVDPVNSRRSKEDRIRGLQPLFASGKIFMRPWMLDLCTELLAFPLGANDDIADALAMQLSLWSLTKSLEERKTDTAADDPMRFEGAVAEIRKRQAAKRRGNRSCKTLDILAGSQPSFN